MPNKANFAFPQTQLSLLPAVKQLALRLAAQCGDEDVTNGPEENLLDWFAESHMEGIGSSWRETSDDEKWSCRSFTSKLRIAPDDLAQVKRAIGYKDRAYNQFGLSSLIVMALSVQEQYSGILAQLNSEATEPVGPYFPNRSKLQLLCQFPTLAAGTTSEHIPPQKATAKFLGQVVDLLSKKHPVDEFPWRMLDSNLLPFAGLFNVEPADMQVVVKGLRKAGLDESLMFFGVAEVILQVVRVTPQFRTGLAWAQFERDNS